MEVQQVQVFRLAAWHLWFRDINFCQLHRFWLVLSRIISYKLSTFVNFTDCLEIHQNWLQCYDERPPSPSQTLGSTCDFKVESIEAAWLDGSVWSPPVFTINCSSVQTTYWGNTEHSRSKQKAVRTKCSRNLPQRSSRQLQQASLQIDLI